jgi:hypothetical protein
MLSSCRLDVVSVMRWHPKARAGVGTVSGTGALDGDGYARGSASLRERTHIFGPRGLVGRGRDGPSSVKTRAAPRTDPSVQDYRTGLLPWGLTLKR